MLQIKNISKTYKTGDLVQVALDNVSLNLRDNEFVAILGPSGSGKTTLLNIIGGLDRYDDGDLVINNVSTKKYKDRDWDTYRNHTIGFVFQSYNLIPHQTVLSNVELALTIGGISRKQRKKLALDALDKVGLKDQAHKKPNQMSGGQMQRVAIARALVNDPDILLADEPTGALDSKTSVQVMDLLKEVANDRLVVMVTHNPELANEYANRIVNLKDGHIISDSNPFVVEDKPLNNKPEKVRKAHMSYLTALSLSFNNLLTKKGRTILTAFAGSIGIIGIALILALSTGFQNYIDKIQEDTMSSYPLTIQSETANIFGALLTSRSESNEEVQEGQVKEQMMITTMMNSVGTNDLKTFKKWLEDNENLYDEYVTDITYAYSVSPRIYTKDVTDTIVQINPNTLMSSIYSDSAMSLLSSVSSSSSMGIFTEADIDSLKQDCELLQGRWPESYDEVIIVLSEKDKISDLLVYSLGLRENSELKTLINDVMSKQETKIHNTPKTFTYDDLMNVELKLVDSSDLYKYNSKYNTYEDMTSDKDYMEIVYRNSENLKITGIAYSTEDSSSTAGVIYSKELVQHVIDKASNSKLVKKQLADKDTDVFSGNSFDEENERESLDFNDMVSVDEEMLKNAFKINISEDDFKFDVDTGKIGSATVNYSKTAVEEIVNNPAGATQYVALLSGLNITVVQSVIDQYETIYVTNDELDLSQVDDFKNQAINKETYKAVFNAMSQMGGNAGLDIFFSDSYYEDLSKDCQNMFSSYYGKVKEIDSDDDNKVAYSKDQVEGQEIVTYSDISSGESKMSSAIIADIMSDPTNMINTLTVSSKLFMTEKIMGQMAQALTESMSSMTDSLSSLGDLFSGDIITVDTDAFAKAFNFDMDEDEVSRIMSSMLTSSSASYSNNLINLGYQDVNDPTSISIYFKDFDSKESFLDILKGYNDSVDEDTQIKYTDITGLLMSSVKTIVDVVTYVLIAFVSISLVVSSIMISVITLISIMERTKEIGILRAMGASKRNVSSIFSAETFIIGLLSGGIGVGTTLILIPIINKIIHSVTGNYDVNAVLPTNAAIVLVIIAISLTIISGFIPSKKAAKQDPVIALRTE